MGEGGGRKVNKSREGSAPRLQLLRCEPVMCPTGWRQCKRDPGRGQRRGCEVSPKGFPASGQKEEAALPQGVRAGKRRRWRGCLSLGSKATSTSFRAGESNQRPKDDHTCRIYSPPLYRLSYPEVRHQAAGDLTFSNAATPHWDTR